MVRKIEDTSMKFLGLDLTPFLREWRAMNMIEAEQNTDDKEFSREYRDSGR